MSGSTCICSVIAKHERQEATPKHSKSIKHRAVSPIQQNAKRIKQDTAAGQPSESAEMASSEASELQTQNPVRDVSSDGHLASVGTTSVIAGQGSTAHLTFPSSVLDMNSFPNLRSGTQNEYWYTDELETSSHINPFINVNLNAPLAYPIGADIERSLNVYSPMESSLISNRSINSAHRVEIKSQPSDFLAIQDRKGTRIKFSLYRNIS